MRIVLIVELLALLSTANTVPLLVKRWMGERWAWPLDGGLTLWDGRPLFGRSKTLRGLAFGIAACTLLAALLGLGWAIGLVAGAAALAGDLLSSFVKRRLGFTASSKATGIDQIPESLLPLLAVRTALDLSVAEIAVTVAIFFAGEIVLARLFHRLGLRDTPY